MSLNTNNTIERVRKYIGDCQPDALVMSSDLRNKIKQEVIENTRRTFLPKYCSKTALDIEDPPAKRRDHFMGIPVFLLTTTLQNDLAELGKDLCIILNVPDFISKGVKE